MRASERSVLLTTRMTGSPLPSALRSTKRVCGSGPSEASTSSATPSTMDRPRSTSPPKPAGPGVAVAAARRAVARPAPAAEVAWARGGDDVDEQVLATHRGVLREDGDALLALEVHRVHDPVL